MDTAGGFEAHIPEVQTTPFRVGVRVGRTARAVELARFQHAGRTRADAAAGCVADLVARAVRHIVRARVFCDPARQRLASASEDAAVDRRALTEIPHESPGVDDGAPYLLLVRGRWWWPHMPPTKLSRLRPGRGHHLRGSRRGADVPGNAARRVVIAFVTHSAAQAWGRALSRALLWTRSSSAK